MPALKQAATVSWSSTLRLPKSRFPPRPIIADRAKYLKKSCDDLYQWQKTANPPEKDPFVLHDGPPYANGSLHVGHALNKILKDTICRSRLLKGHRVNYVPGWDCHGLPIELKALQQERCEAVPMGEPLGATRIRELARRLAERTVEEQKAMFRQWAVMGEWDNAWKTTDQGYELAQLRVFGKMLEKGLIYRNEKPVYWSPSSRTALAEAELEYNAEHQSTAAYVKFPLLDPPRQLQEAAPEGSGEISVAIWTTTPWTLVANRAIAVDEGLEYCLVNSTRYGLFLVATSRLDEVAKSCNENLPSTIIKTVQGIELLGAVYRNPLLEGRADQLRIHHAGFVSSDSGTGIVHMAPGHGMDDYKLCQSLGISPFAPVDNDGRFTAEALPHNPDLLLGKPVIGEGNQAVLHLLQAEKALINSHVYQHSYPYDWRSKKPVIIRATKQWFADLEGIRPQTLRSLRDVNFIPETSRGRLEAFVQTRTEWCISRQRPWGVPIPALYECDTHKALMTPASVEHIIRVMKNRGSEAWWTDEVSDPAWILPSLRGTAEFYRGQDTMDVWFDSGTSWTQMTNSVADLYIEGTDQHRGWFQSSLLTRIATSSIEEESSRPQAPYKTLITHGFTLDQDSRKMSKSIGNVIDPEEIMGGTLLPPVTRKPPKGSKDKKPQITHDALGPDALRMWVASSDYTRDIVVSTAVLQAVNNNVAKLRVTFKLLLGFLETYHPQSPITFQNLELNNQLALIELQHLVALVHSSFKSFEYHRAASAIYTYVATNLSAGYIETIKDRMYTDAARSPLRTETQAVVWLIFQRLTDVLSPITPLLVEEALDYLPPQLSYHPIRSTWQRHVQHDDSVISGEWHNPELVSLTPYLSEVHSAVKALQEQARSDKKMGSSLQSDVTLYIPRDSWLRGAIENHRVAVEDMLVVSGLEIKDTPSRGNEEGGEIKDTIRPENNEVVEWSYHRELPLDCGSVHLTVKSPANEKCVRCWKYTASKELEREDTLCTRCVGVLEGLRDDTPGLFDGKPRLDEAAKKCRHSMDEQMKRHWDLV